MVLKNCDGKQTVRAASIIGYSSLRVFVVVAPPPVVTPPICGNNSCLHSDHSFSAWAADVLAGMVQMVVASGGGKGQSHTVG